MTGERRRRVALTVVAIVAVLLAVTGAAAATSATTDQLTVTAYFADAQPLVSGNEVKASGVPIGTIDTVTLENGKAKVEMTVDRTILPLHTDATARIVQLDLLGERFVDLQRGSPAAPVVSEPYVLRTEQTSRGTDLQEILNEVDDPTGTALAAMFTETGEGLRGQGDNTAAAIDALRPAMQQTGELSGILGQQNQVLRQLVDRARPVAEAVAGARGERLDRLVGSTTDTLGVVAGREQKVQETLNELPGTLSSARTTLARLAGVADPAADTLKAIRPVTNDLRDISGELRRFSEVADPALASLPGVLKRGNELFEELGPLVKALRPAGPELRGIAPAARNLSEEALHSRLTNLLEFVKGWSLATADYDAISHYFKAILVTTPKALGTVGGSFVPGFPTTPVPSLPLPLAPGATPGSRPNGTPAPGFSSAEGGAAPRGEAPTDNNRTGPPGVEPGTPSSPNGGATGLRPNQENAMLDQLLGGS